jgi:hypothetical protein
MVWMPPKKDRVRDLVFVESARLNSPRDEFRLRFAFELKALFIEWFSSFSTPFIHLEGMRILIVAGPTVPLSLKVHAFLH